MARVLSQQRASRAGRRLAVQFPKLPRLFGFCKIQRHERAALAYVVVTIDRSVDAG